ncbi:hypothetical protein GJ496_004836 [Pomphorhynchus laevis]|nr:hypothetical protein GJ496_004836 [Pomphorhynchus laevis]
MVQMSGIKYIVYAGTFAATLSSASAVLVSGPKVFQAVCRDNILPDFLKFFAVGHSQTDEPNRLYILNFLLCAVLVCIGDLNAIANLLTNFVLLGYTFINLACFYASFSKSPSWRPTFKYYNKYVALFTALLCVLIMFLVQPVFAALTLLIELILYLFVKWKNPVGTANWGSSSDANNYRIGFRLLKSCAMHGVHAKNFRPQCLILSGPPTSRLSLIKLVNKITKSHSLTICGNVIMNEDANLQDIQKTSLITREYFADQKIHSFYTPIINSSLRHGVRALMQCSGFGVVKPNILVMGFKKDWMLPETKLTTEYFEIIRDALDMSMGIVIARLTGQYETDSNEELIQIDEEDEADVDVIQTVYENSDDISYTQSSQHINTNEISLKISRPEQFIDIWWLFDDGGLTILFPYLLSTRKSWRDHQLRIFIPCLNDSEMSYHKMAHMLNEFRIPYQSIQTITDIFDPPSSNLTEKYYKLIEPIRCSDDKSGDISKICISEKEIIANKQNIDYYIKLRELLVKHSTESTLIFITMPIPRDEGVSAGLYLSWLEFISSDLPSVLFIRGNQENVLTYYT